MCRAGFAAMLQKESKNGVAEDRMLVGDVFRLYEFESKKAG